MDFVIRPATEKDLPEMLGLWREMMDFHAHWDARFRPKPSPEAEQAWMNYLREEIWGGNRWCTFVAEEDGRLVGHIVGELREQVPVFEHQTYGYVTDIVVGPEARRQGIGTALFEAVETWFREQGATHVQLQVLASNPASQAFWRAVGCTDYMNTLWYDLETE
jgi:ribosomal protein S18 acetylase RimI-like enzyme